ncbi:MAG: hypothetical protein ACYSTY_12595 [Planctomycetota bacterium]|jgi:hypothetical protein
MHPRIHRALLGLSLVAALCLSCDGSARAPSACDGLADKLVGITRADYATCAGEILAVLEALEPLLRRIVLEEASDARPEAQAAYKRLRHLMRQVDYQGDIDREARAQSPALKIERWPDGSMHSFNLEVGYAAAQFSSALRHPNEGNLQEGSRRHSNARRAYAHFR